MRDLQAIFFDFDGVILESVDVKGWAFAKLFDTYPEHVEEIVSYHYAHGGMPRFDKFRHIYREILKEPLSDELFRELCDRFSELALERVLQCPFVPGALEFLKKHHAAMPDPTRDIPSRPPCNFIYSGKDKKELFTAVGQEKVKDAPCTLIVAPGDRILMKQTGKLDVPALRKRLSGLLSRR